ncbi:MAG: hypothetical protein F4219_08200 [Gammaproteobacteria bacterium]|nr:hypothetical protein [Gammaproteobacteria bacterium]
MSQTNGSVNLQVKLEPTSPQTLSLRTVVQVAQLELRSTLRLFRLWLVFLLLSGASLSAYVLSCLVFVNIAPFNFSFGGGTPLYLLGHLDPAYFLFFQTGLLLLLLDQQHRIRRNRLEEVIESRPVRNLEYQIGHTLCYSGLIWVIVCANVLLMQLIGVSSKVFNFHVADTLQLHSVFNLLFIDAPVSLLIWTSLFLLWTKLFGSRMLILFAGLSVMIGYYFGTLNTPHTFVDLISQSSNQTLFVSDI